LRGASAFQSLLATQRDPHLRVFVVWEPVLPMDFSAPSSITLHRIADRRVTQYWDHDRVLSHLMGEHDPASIVWDYLAVYSPEQLWTAAPPQPGFQGGPVVRAVTGADQFLQALTAPVAK